MAELNLDDLRALRDEGAEKGPLIFNGEKFSLPTELPWEATLLLGDPTTQRDGFRVLFGDEQFERFLLGQPSVEDMKAIAEWLEAEYLGSPGKGSAGSRTSSRATPASSKPTSKGSTGSS